MTPGDVRRFAAKKEKDEAAAAVAGACSAPFIWAGFLTLGWNYGVTEFATWGGDPNVGYLAVFLTVLGVRAAVMTLRGHDTNG